MCTTIGYCCTSCNKKIQQSIVQSLDTVHYSLFSTFIILGLVLVLLSYLTLRTNKSKLAADTSKRSFGMPLAFSAMVLGIGLGGFVDGIVLHQILQWHEMLSNKISSDTLINKSVNMFWDGIFHLFTLLVTLAGIYLLFKILKKNNLIHKSGYLMTGGMLCGWGIFNLIEGIINHRILELHHVRDLSPNKDLWDFGFLLFGFLLLLVGALMIRKASKKHF